ncbi:MAG: AraC family transcriptional regulator [Eubacteriales bacterium]|nr:AraC family transcriptional regulator [Eubacteriales bacterium]
MLLESDFNSENEQPVRLSIDRQQQEAFPIDMAAAPFLCKKNVIEDRNATAEGEGSAAVPWHWHNAFEINYVVSGDLLWRTRDAEHVMHKGEISIVNSGVMHACSAVEDSSCEYYTLIFDMHFLSGMYNSVFEEKYFLPITRNDDLRFWPVRPDSLLHIKMVENVLEAVEVIREKAFGYEFRLRSLLSDFWLLFLQDTEEVRAAAPPRTTVDTERIRIMTRYIQEHCTEKITLEDVAAAADISTRECTRCFRRCLNTSPIVYLTQTRVDMAAKLLAGSAKSIIEISEDCGFSSPSYFGKVFREIMDCTPTDYRTRSAGA